MVARRFAMLFAFVAILSTPLLPAQTALAVNYDYIEGDAYAGWPHYFESGRIITEDYDQTAGPSVAFWQGYGPNDWSLGAWDCNLTTNHYGLHDMEPGRWNYVADGLVEGYEFCTMAQHYDPPNYPLWFGGDLSWD